MLISACITDKTGTKFYQAIVKNKKSFTKEMRYLEKTLKQAKKYPALFTFLDVETACIETGVM